MSFKVFYILYFFSFEMIWIVLCGHSSGFKHFTWCLLNSKAGSHVCFLTLDRFGHGFDAFNVLYTMFIFIVSFAY
jgi:hypothetical protein